jgi:inner membrane transporter RhtA
MGGFNKMTANAPPSSHPPMLSSLPALAGLAVAMVSVQVGASLAKGLFPAVGAQGATALRVTIAALILVAAFRPWRKLPPRKTWPVLGGYGLALGLMNLSFYTALQTIPLGVAVALEFTGPLAVAVLSSRRWIDFLWIALAVAGLAILLPIWRQAHPVNPLGVGFALGAGVCWALYIVFGNRAGAAHGPGATAIGMVIAALVVAPVGAAQAGSALLSPALLPVALGVALLSSVLPYTFEMFALTRIPIRVFGTLMSVEPAIAACMGWLILHERLTTPQWAAIGAIMAASIGATLTMGRTAAPAEVPPTT